MTNVIVLDAAQQPEANPTATHVVAVGARMLDLRLPAWFDSVDPEILDQAYPELCVLGQVDPRGWLAALQTLFPDLDEQARFRAAERSGFWVNDHQPEDVAGEALSDACLTRYEQLTQAWRAAIVARRNTWR